MDRPSVELPVETFKLDTIIPGDENLLIPVFRAWVKKRVTGEVQDKEIADIQARMRESLVNPEVARYFVMRDVFALPVGLVGVKLPDEMTSLAVTTERPLELINFFVHPKLNGKGIGSTLLNTVIAYASTQGFTEVILNSGPRYMRSAWDFYNNRLEQIGILINAYNADPEAEKSFAAGVKIDNLEKRDILVNGHAPVWQQLI